MARVTTRAHTLAYYNVQCQYCVRCVSFLISCVDNWTVFFVVLLQF